MDKSISAEYILFACDNDFKLAEKLCKRLNGLCLNFSEFQIKKLKAQKLLLDGNTIREVATELDMLENTVYKMKQRMVREGLVYYTGEIK